MVTSKVTMVLGAMLSSGMLMAQVPATPNPGANPDTQLTAQSAGQSAGQGSSQGSSQGSAQSAPMRGGRHAMNPDKQAKHLAKELSLSKDQVEQIKPILAERDQQMESLRGDASMAPRDRHAKMRDIQQDSKGKIEALLSDTQKEQFEKMLAERREHHKGGRA